MLTPLTTYNMIDMSDSASHSAALLTDFIAIMLLELRYLSLRGLCKECTTIA